MKKYLEEIEAGFTPLTICQEAARCLLCHDAPCSKECPAGTDPGKFIRSVRFKNYKGAAETIRENNILGAICARVCPTEKYCQKGCSRSGIDKPIDIGRIQRYVTDLEASLNMKILKKGPSKNKKIAVVGSGPGGLSIAGNLLLKGYRVEIYEKERNRRMVSMNMTINSLKLKAAYAFASVREKIRDFFIRPRYVSGITVIELVLILVIIIALLLIFKTQLINLINTIFDKITSESSGI